MTVKLVCSNCKWVQDTDAKWVLCPNCECDTWVIVETEEGDNAPVVK